MEDYIEDSVHEYLGHGEDGKERKAQEAIHGREAALQAQRRVSRLISSKKGHGGAFMGGNHMCMGQDCEECEMGGDYYEDEDFMESGSGVKRKTKKASKKTVSKKKSHKEPTALMEYHKFLKRVQRDHPNLTYAKQRRMASNLYRNS